MADTTTTAPTHRGGRGGRGRGNSSNRGQGQQSQRGGRGNQRGSRGRGRGRGHQHGHGHQPHYPHDNISTVLPPTITTTAPTNTTTTTHQKQAQSFKVVSTNTPASPEKVIPASHITISNASNNTSTTTTNAPTGLKKPEFIKVAKLQPGGKGYNLVLKVADVNMVVDKKSHDNSSSLRVAEAIVGDDTGVIVLSAKNEQIDVVKRGATIVVRNGRVDVFNKKMRLRVDNWGLLQSFENGKKATTVPLSDAFTVNTVNNVSLKEYETVYTYE